MAGRIVLSRDNTSGCARAAMRHSGFTQYPGTFSHRVDHTFMRNAFDVKTEQLEGKLENNSNTEHGNDRADADLGAQ